MTDRIIPNLNLPITDPQDVLVDITTEDSIENRLVRVGVTITLPPVYDAYVKISPDSFMVSKLGLGLSHVDNSDLVYNNPNGISNAITNLKGAFFYQNEPIMGWGAPDLWPWNKKTTPTLPEPNNWGYLDKMVALMDTLGGEKILSLWSLPSWMKGKLYPDKSTTALDPISEQYYADGRPLTEQLNNMLHLIEKVAERYLQRGVSTFVTGMEFHGYYLGRNYSYNSMAWDAFPGTPGFHADVGSSYVTNTMIGRIIQVAQRLGIDRSKLKFGNNYPAIGSNFVTDGSSVPVGHPLRDRPWGSVDKRGLENLFSSLPLMPEIDLIGFDMASGNRDNAYGPITDWQQLEKFTDICRFVMSELALRGYGDKQVIINEFYPKSAFDPGTGSQQYRAALTAEGIRRVLLEGISAALFWSPRGHAQKPGDETEAAMVTSTATADGGQPTPILKAIKLFKDYFPPGTPIHNIAIEGVGLSGIASDSILLLINQKKETMRVGLWNDVVQLGANDVRAIIY